MDHLDEVRDSFVNLWGSLGTFWGVSPTTARVYGWLLSREAGADAEEIMVGLTLSRGAVSMACRELRDWGLILPDKAGGSRRVVWLPETDLERVLKNVVQMRKRREWDPIREHLHEWIPRLESDPSPEAKAFRDRLARLEGLVDLLDTMAERVLHGGTVVNLGLKAMVGTANRRPRERKRVAR